MEGGKEVAVDLDELRPCPYNPRTIAEDAMALLMQSIKQHTKAAGGDARRKRFRLASTITVNRNGNRILGGHQRVEALRRLGARNVHDDDITWVNVPNDSAAEKALVLSLNRQDAAGDWNQPVLNDLVHDIQLDDAGLAADLNLSALQDVNVSVDVEAHAKLESPDGDFAVVGQDPFIIYPADGDWELPALREDMLADVVPRRVLSCATEEDDGDGAYMVVQGSFKFDDLRKRERGVLAFFSDDARFEVAWNRKEDFAQKVVRHGWGAVVAPDYSTWYDDPLPVQLWNVYRNRWLARWWQDWGVKIIPNVQWSDARSLEYTLEGIPCGAPVVALQCRNMQDKAERTRFVHGFRKAMKVLDPQTVVVYGGAKHVDGLFKGLGGSYELVMISDFTEVRRSKGAYDGRNRRRRGR